MFIGLVLDVTRSRRHIEGEDKDRLSLEILLSALLDADKEKATTGGSRKSVRINVPSQHEHKAAKSKANYSFSTDRSRMIDMENQRLLNVSCFITGSHG